MYLRFNAFSVFDVVVGCRMLAFVVLGNCEDGEEHTDRDEVLLTLQCGGGGGIDVLPPPLPLLVTLEQRNNEIDGGGKWRTNLPL